MLESMAQAGSAINTFDVPQIRLRVHIFDQHQDPGVQGQVGQPLVAILVKIDQAPIVEGQGAPVPLLIENEQRHYEKF